MAGPIGYVPPANPYAAMPLEQPRFTGLNPMPAQAAALQAEAPIEQKIKESETYDTQAQLAAQFQQQLNKGVAGMQSYIGDVQKENPELAQHFTQELQTMAPFLQTLKGKDLNDAVFNLYDSWNGRYNGAKLGKVMNDPFSTDQDVFGAYAANGGSADKLMSAYTTNQKTQAMTPYWQARAGEAASRGAYYDQLPALKTKLGEMAAEAKVRAAKLRSNKDGSGYQVSYKDAKDAYDQVQKRIEELSASDPSAGVDPSTGQPYPLWQRNMIRENVGWNKTMNDLVKEQNQWRMAMIRAEAHGAKPGDSLNLDTPPGVTAPGMSSSQPGAAPAGPPAELKSTSSPDQIKNYLRSLNPNREPSDQDIQKAIQALKAMGR